jgi:hypothetical protein
MKTGQHEYKFNVDGGWRVAPADPLVMDPEVRQLHIGARHCVVWQLLPHWQ